MKETEASRPATPPVAASSKKPYQAPILREYGSLVKLTAGTGSIGGDLSKQMGIV
ncbi:MAG: lasso RiPP family leader peptide-containing protein [Planctomycetota bacterium]